MKGMINLAMPIEVICQRIAAEYNKSLEDLRGKDRHEDLVWPRQLAMNLCYQAGHNYRSICGYFGRTTGSLTYTNKEVERMCSVYDGLKKHRIIIARDLGIPV